MKAIRYHAYGGPEQLRYEDAPVPAPKVDEVLVRVRATSVNPWDYKLASGAFRSFVPSDFPYIPGGEFAGEVEAVGAAVRHVKPAMRSTAIVRTAPTRSSWPRPTPRSPSSLRA
jgi:NADPH:quinone reductase-like Zn-dependent oxidoreductase